ncbi:MAG: PIN domain-containing protein [Bryobacterales bacterium]|nr:PIN domain-containing protein [Bryobacterales bacterium]
MRKAPSEPILLLDANVLLALAWPNHQFHDAALARLEPSRERWATCALTELAFIRLSSNPAAVTHAKTPAEAVALLAAMTRDPRHVCLRSLEAPVAPAVARWLVRATGHTQITDAYLLALAESHRAVLLTFDARLSALAGSDVAVEVLH